MSVDHQRQIEDNFKRMAHGCLDTIVQMLLPHDHEGQGANVSASLFVALPLLFDVQLYSAKLRFTLVGSCSSRLHTKNCCVERMHGELGCFPSWQPSVIIPGGALPVKPEFLPPWFLSVQFVEECDCVVGDIVWFELSRCAHGNMRRLPIYWWPLTRETVRIPVLRCAGGRMASEAKHI